MALPWLILVEVTTPYPIKISFKYLWKCIGSISYVPYSYPMAFMMSLPLILLVCSNSPWPVATNAKKSQLCCWYSTKGPLVLMLDRDTAFCSGVYPYLHQVCHCPLWRVHTSTGALALAAAEITFLVLCLCRSFWHHDWWHRAFSSIQEIIMKTALLAFIQCHFSLSD